MEVTTHATVDADLPYAFQTTNSSSSDLASPVTPTFSARGHFRGSSSTSSLDLAFLPMQDSPSSPIHQVTTKNSKRQLPDVQEEPQERDEDRTILPDQFSLYSGLCDAPCEHRRVSEQALPGEFVVDYDYDLGCLSDGETSVPRQYKKHDGSDSPLLGLTSRFGSRFNTMNRWKTNKMASLMSSPTTEVSLENVLSRVPSSRSSSMSASRYQLPERHYDPPQLATPSMSYYGSTDSLDFYDVEPEMTYDERAALERDRAHATTPLLPPLMTSSRELPQESPLQSPSIECASAVTEVHVSPIMSGHRSIPSLSAKPSFTSLRHVPTSLDLPLPLPPLLQEHDEWSDRLGHANFTITPLPYELEKIDADTVAKFRDDWDAARVNYTKHLVRTGEHYGQTSKIYALTEAKWAETEGRWRATYERALRASRPANLSGTSSPNASRSRSRGRGRGRSGSASAIVMGRPVHDDFFAEEQWRRLEEDIPSAVCRMLEAEGKFPSRGDEDIVGPMHRAETMERSHSEEKYGSKFWKNLAGKVGLRR